MNMDYYMPLRHNLIIEWIILVFRIEKKNFEYVDAVNRTRHERNVDLENNFGLGHFSPPLRIMTDQGWQLWTLWSPDKIYLELEHWYIFQKSVMCLSLRTRAEIRQPVYEVTLWRFSKTHF